MADEPLSRVEEILEGGSPPLLSRIEKLLQEGSAGGGVTPEQIAAAVEAYLGEHGVVIDVDSELSTTSEKPVQNKVIAAALNGKGTYSKPSDGIPTNDLDLVDLRTWLDDAGAIIYTLSLSGTTITLDKSFLAVYSGLIYSARQNLFILPIGGTTQNPVVLILPLQKVDAQTYSITLGGEYNGNRYSVTLSAASATASPMAGTLTVEPLAELPTVTASDNGKFLRVVSGAWAAATVPSAESASFGGGST